MLTVGVASMILKVVDLIRRVEVNKEEDLRKE
jgi:hypothetical protein